jgi:hypothetical protein
MQDVGAIKNAAAAAAAAAAAWISNYYLSQNKFVLVEFS